MFNTIIFDVDGTLLDTRTGIINSVNYVIEKFNLKKLNDEEMQQFIGMSPIQASFQHFCGTDEFLSQKCAEEYRDKYKRGDVFNAEVYGGVFALLDYLKRNGYKLGIATYKRQDNINEIVKFFNFDKYFDSICGADNDNKLTKTEIIKKCMSNLNSLKQKNVMIGDSIHDATAAEKLGIKFIGVTYGFGFKSSQDVNKYSNIFIAKNTMEILEYFKKRI